MRRLVVSFATVVALLAVAGILWLLLLVFPGETGENDVERAVADDGKQSAVELVSDAVAIGLVEAAEDARAIEAVEAEIRVLSGLVVDGAPARRESIESLVRADVSYTDHVGFIDQRQVMASGCELAALAVALNSWGISVTPNDIADHHLRTGSNLATDYLGSPYRDGGGFPPVIVDAANSWLGEHGFGARAHDSTGTPFDVALGLTQAGYPVVVWTTVDLKNPQFAGPVVEGWQWYSPEHCVVLFGVEGDEVLVSDSLEGIVKRDRAEFERIYAACGNKSLILF